MTLAKGFVSAFDGILDREDLSSTEKLTALALLRFWSTTNPRPFPGVDLLARRTGFCRRAVLKSLARLRKLGLIADAPCPRGCSVPRNRHQHYSLDALFGSAMGADVHLVHRTSGADVHLDPASGAPGALAEVNLVHPKGSTGRDQEKYARARVRACVQAREAPTLDALVAASGSTRSPCSVVRELLAEATDGPGWPVDRWHAELLEMARKPIAELDRVLDALQRDEWIREHPMACSPSYLLDRWEHYAVKLKPPTRAPAPPPALPTDVECVPCPPELAEVVRRAAGAR
jgi:hypothetical protein